MSDTNWILFNNKYIRSKDAKVPVESRIVRYGDGCFDTMRAYKGRFLKPEEHYLRLKGAMRYLGLSTQVPADVTQLLTAIRELLARNQLIEEEALVRIQVWRKGKWGYDVSGMADADFGISVMPLPEIKSHLDLVTVGIRRVPDEAVSSKFKLSNGINYITATTEARNKDADDALMLTTDGFVSETPIANIFWITKNEIYTPDDGCDLLPGITRDLLIQIIKNDMDIPLNTGQYTLDSLYKADSCWICNSVREIIPVQRVDKVEFEKDHDILTDLCSKFQQLKMNLLV